MTKMATTSAPKDFSPRDRALLARAWITIVGSTWLPGTDKSFANGERGYKLVDDFGARGMSMIRTYAQIVDFVAGFRFIESDVAAGLTSEQSFDLATTPASPRSDAWMDGARRAREIFDEITRYRGGKPRSAS